jgi:hypothetical protein
MNRDERPARDHAPGPVAGTSHDQPDGKMPVGRPEAADLRSVLVYALISERRTESAIRREASSSAHHGM